MSVLGETVLKENARKRVGEIFLGMRQRLGIAQAMLSGPSVPVPVPGWFRSIRPGVES